MTGLLSMRSLIGWMTRSLKGRNNVRKEAFNRFVLSRQIKHFGAASSSPAASAPSAEGALPPEAASAASNGTATSPVLFGLPGVQLRGFVREEPLTSTEQWWSLLLLAPRYLALSELLQLFCDVHPPATGTIAAFHAWCSARFLPDSLRDLVSSLPSHALSYARVILPDNTCPTSSAYGPESGSGRRCSKKKRFCFQVPVTALHAAAGAPAACPAIIARVHDYLCLELGSHRHLLARCDLFAAQSRNGAFCIEDETPLRQCLLTVDNLERFVVLGAGDKEGTSILALPWIHRLKWPVSRA